MSDLMKGRASSSSEFVQDKKYEVYLGKKEKKNMVCPTSQLVQEEKHEYSLGKRGRFDEEEHLGRKLRNKSEYKLGDRHGPKNEKLNLGKIEKNNGENSLVDPISGTPDEILVSILSLLPLKDAGATTALSRRWQCVWMSTMTLNFDVNFHLHRNRLRFRHSRTKLQHLESCRYVNWVDHVAEQHRGAIKQFKACFGLDGQFTSSIDKWIQFAMKKGVEILELDFFLNRGVAAENLYMFPSKPLGLGKEHLYPYTPNLHSCGYDIGFKFLKVLHFRSVDVTDDVLEYFLSNYPGLERLAVHRTKSLVNVRVGGSSVALKYLVVEHCLHLKSIEICDANLVSFIYKGQEINLVLSNVPFLVEVSISADPTSIDLPFTQLSCCLPQLETLMLDICEVYYNQKRAFPISENLKHLELIVEADHRWALHHLTYFLKAFPCLQRLAVKLDYSDPEGGMGKVKKASACPHHCLKVVEIVGYRGRESAVKHVLYLIKSLVALEKIIIDPVQRFEYPVERYPSGIDRGVEVVDEEEEVRDHAMQYLKRKVPSSIEFVCL